MHIMATDRTIIINSGSTALTSTIAHILLLKGGGMKLLSLRHSISVIREADILSLQFMII